ncbi:MAG: tRNA (adenosine(37)-N6)-threonylcarbamoyltransferase complex dimerization subunit type 1 TsaB [Prevotellaceae bacterium]|jgi:tRNA threonylcarbamoyladenosine biosynthesis protein TsaB|nr:tRNA (adenosine(37)-N6)-threonylcarbamoyltransferase complex dimerization subunit type 1 TsaB [Prevotellaceae bacterium]
MNQPVILHIETSTNVCSVAASEGAKCLFSLSNDEGLNHAALLSSFIEKALEELKTQSKTLDAVAVSGGPGSYTGLRIGVSTAKGLCYGLDIPLIETGTLSVMYVPVAKDIKDKNALLCPMIDARRMEVYAALFDAGGNIKKDAAADIITPESYAHWLSEHVIYFFGNGSDKCKNILKHPNARFINDITPLAENMILLALNKFNAKEFADLAYYEPFYLKEFQTTTPKGLAP